MPLTALEIPCGELTLVGALHTPDGDGPFVAAVVCHPHPQMGGDMYNNVVLAIVEGLVERGIAAVRFNFRGSGGSEGSHDGGAAEQDDVRAALAHTATLPEVDSDRIGLAGYSFGAGMAAQAAPSVASTAVGSAPVLALVSMPLRRLDSADAIADYPSPLLLMTGDLDEFGESGTLEELGSEIDRATTDIVEGADHFWLGFESQISNTVGDFFAENL
ncbi:MAG TPA: alpha/beta family hydrolase [Dehalococcoidia bacterium]|nr:alpha/beta family hydrolase [Dehalococcoidia bacterium]